MQIDLIIEPNDSTNWDRLTESEWLEYIALVDAFAIAKKEKRYAESDAIREKLLEWQDNTSEQEFIKMHEIKHYRWHSVFETQGENGHRFIRVQKRIAANLKDS